MNSGTSRNIDNPQALRVRDREMLSIMEEISENPFRSSYPGTTEPTGRNAVTETRTTVGAEVPVPADDGWSEESRRTDKGMRDGLIGVREPPGL